MFVLTCAIISRMSSAANLGREILVLRSVLSFDDQTLANISSLQDHFVHNLTSLEKQISLGNIRGYLRVQKLFEDPELCLSQILSLTRGGSQAKPGS